ncbi:putative methylase [Triangularia setosa]|uniref:Methylase n=1 Tax=Triangularia setosa TaxID=2587417 RepID=A0AAN6VXB0_9PEZI|nr:putative methylase [Podospora setosa]
MSAKAPSHRAAKELSKLFETINKAASSANVSWEDVLLDNARRVSTPLVIQMLAQMGLDLYGNKPIAPFKLFENACGAGVVAPVLQKTLKPDVLAKSSILCGDFSTPCIGLIEKRIKEEGWVNTEVKRIDAQKTKLESASFDYVTTNIGFHVIPDSEAALDETVRILKPGGVLGFTTWHRPPTWVDELQEVFASFPFEAPYTWTLQMTPWGQWTDVQWVRKTLAAKGLEDVNVDIYAHLSKVDSPTHFITQIAMMIDWIMDSAWSEELRKAHPREEVQGLVKDYLEKKYEGGSWDISWVSLIASARKPL